MKNELEVYAKFYYNLGFNVTCITNYLTEYNFNEKNLTKSPYHKWENFEKERQELDELKSYDWQNATGVGLALGFNNIRALDIDGCIDIDIVYEILNILGLPDKYEWVIRSGSQNGFHIIFFSEEVNLSKGLNRYSSKIKEVIAYSALPEIKHKIEKIEFRWNNHLVLPPSIHKSSLKYKFQFTNFPKRIPLKVDEEKLTDVIDKFIEIEQVGCGGSNNDPIYGGKQTMINNVNLSPHDIRKKFGPWLRLVVDVETDGLPNDLRAEVDDPDNWPNIIQIAWILLDKDDNVCAKDSVVINDQEIKSKNYVNIDFDQLDIIGLKLRDALEKFSTYVEVAWYFIAHNAEFDFKVLKAAYKKVALDSRLDKLEKLCIMKSSKDFCKLEGDHNIDYKYPKLEELYYCLFNEEVLGLHNAEKDVLAATKCYIRLKQNKVPLFYDVY
jgi:DNA polymerase III epsilon subunit-like protein